MIFLRYLLWTATNNAVTPTRRRHQGLVRTAKRKVSAEKTRAIAKNFFELMRPLGIALVGWTTISMSLSVMSFQISAAKKPEYKVAMVKKIGLIISIENRRMPLGNIVAQANIVAPANIRI